MRRLLTTLGLFLICSNALLAVTPQSWTVDTTEEFLAGEIEGFTVSARGEIRPGPNVTKLASLSDPFVLSQVSNGKGTLFLGTGNSGNVYRLRNGKVELLYQAPEPEIYAISFVDGQLIVGSSPNGKLYSVDPRDGAAKELFDPEEAYIWDIEVIGKGRLAVATGIEGRIYEVDLDGEGKVLFDTPDMHVRSLATSKGRILAGTAGNNGRIYEIDASGSGRAIYEATFTEISAIEIDESSGTAWAAGATTVLPTKAPTRNQKNQPQKGQGSAQTAEAEKAQDTATVDVSFSFGSSPTAQAARVGASEVYRIDKDGFVTSARRFEREIVYALEPSDTSTVDIATGPAGRVYRFDGSDLSLIASVPEKQIVSLGKDSPLTVTTTNTGAVYQVSADNPEKIEIRSSAGDTHRYSSFGEYEITGRNLPDKGLTVSFRSGHTSTPDETWSSWQSKISGATGGVNAPSARYVQWKIEAEAPATDFVIDSVRVSYLNRNLAPSIETANVHEPGLVFVAAAYPSSPQVLEATNPDEYGIFNSLDNPRDRNDPGKRLFRRGYRTVSWRTSDENGDALRHDLHFRPEGRTQWTRLRENMAELNVNFDTSQLPDGHYEIRLTVNDSKSNPEQGLTASRDDLTLVVDNTPPVISSRLKGKEIEITVADEYSPLVKAEYSIDAREWIRIVPKQGFADSKNEVYRLTADEVRGHLVIFRVVDGQYNVATSSITAD